MSFWLGRVQVGAIAATIVMIVVGWLDYLVLHLGWGVEGVPWLRDVVVEANGLAFDVALFGVVILWIDEVRQRRERLRGYQEQLEDYRDWHTDEAALRTAGLVRRISRAGGTVKASRAWLPKANLKDVSLRKGRFRGANLSEAWLFGADLRDASFMAADLTGARLDEALLEGADFRYALRGPDDAPIAGWQRDDEGRLVPE
ncbi:MAG: pentapeptide repeat-containing protein [Myxococcota bacterium]